MALTLFVRSRSDVERSSEDEQSWRKMDNSSPGFIVCFCIRPYRLRIYNNIIERLVLLTESAESPIADQPLFFSLFGPGTIVVQFVLLVQWRPF